MFPDCPWALRINSDEEAFVKWDYSWQKRPVTAGAWDWESGFYILCHTRCPAVLTENLFQDNRDDVAFLLSLEGRERIIRTHVDGILSFVRHQTAGAQL